MKVPKKEKSYQMRLNTEWCLFVRNGIVNPLVDFIEQLLYSDIYHDIKLHSMLDVFGYI